MYDRRIAAVQAKMASARVDALLLTGSSDLTWLCGYRAGDSAAPTLLALRPTGPPMLVVPRMDAATVPDRDFYRVSSYADDEDPVALIGRLLGTPAVVSVGDTCPARLLFRLLETLRASRFCGATGVVGELRQMKDDDEVNGLWFAATAVDAVMSTLLAGDISVIGRTEVAVANELTRMMQSAAADHRVTRVVIASGPHAAIPNQEPGFRVIGSHEAVVVTLSGTVGGYGYSSSRTFWTGPAPEPFKELYGALLRTHRDAVDAARAGRRCGDVDAAVRAAIAGTQYAGLVLHRTGHGIGLDASEEPILGPGITTPLRPGHSLVISPGLYVPGLWGARIGDVVVVTDGPPAVLNRADHALCAVET